MDKLFEDLLGNSFTSNISYYTPYYKIDDNEMYCNINVPAPGVDKELLKVTVVNKTVNLTIPQGDFTKESNFSWDFDYRIKPDMIESFYEDGVIVIIITKPKNHVFEVEID